MRIESQKIEIDPVTKIADDADIVASDRISIGKYAVILPGFKVRCRSLYIGRHCYIGAGVEIGGGGCNGPNAHVFIGDRALICEKSFINCAESVTIGEHVAFGYETQVWTHGVWQPVVDGFPKMDQAPVVIGEEVWLPSRCQVMPGVTIGSHTVVGMGSFVNKDLAMGSLAVGRPAKVIKENAYPSSISDGDLLEELERLIYLYVRSVAPEKGFRPDIGFTADSIITFRYLGKKVVFNIRTKEFKPPYNIGEYAEDFRDFLRRNGFPFYGGGFFESIEPERFIKAREAQ